MIDLNLKDAVIRLRCAPKALFNTPLQPADPAIEKIRRALARQAELGSMEALVVPAAFGQHVDHLTVREAAQPFVSARPAAFYEELPDTAPHAGGAELDFSRGAEARDPLTPAFFRDASFLARKRMLILGYASQIDGEIADLILCCAGGCDIGERLWANSAWCALSDESLRPASFVQPSSPSQ